MRCNYYQDNRKDIESKRMDFVYMALVGIENIPAINCKTGISNYEPTQQDQDRYCFSDFGTCPRFQTKVKRNQ